MDRYPLVEFVKVGDYKYSSNDGRFFMFRDYLLEHSEIEYIFMTDLFDVRINSLPEPADKLYVMSEPEVNPQTGDDGKWNTERRWVRAMFRLFGYDGSLIGKKLFNPGVWGGKRELVLDTLNKLCDRFDKANPGDANCNMLIFNQSMYNDIGEDNIITGYPLHSVFKGYEKRRDTNFNHK